MQRSGRASARSASAEPAAASDVPALVETLKDPAADAKSKIQAVQAIEGAGPSARAAIPALVALLSDKESTYNDHAARALRAIGPDGIRAAIDAVRPMDVKHNSHVHTNVLANLLPDGIPQVTQLLKEGDELLRGDTLSVLGRMRYGVKSLEPEQLDAIRAVKPELIAALENGERTKSRRRSDGPSSAASVLAWLGPEAKEAAPVIAKALARDRNNDMIDALRKIDPANADVLMKTAAAEYRRTQADAPRKNGVKPEVIEKRLAELIEPAAGKAGGSSADVFKGSGDLLRANLPKLASAFEAADEAKRARPLAEALAYAGEPGIDVLVKTLRDKAAPLPRRVAAAHGLKFADPITPAAGEALGAAAAEPAPPEAKQSGRSEMDLGPVAVRTLMQLAERDVADPLHGAAPALAKIVGDESRPGQMRADAAGTIANMTPKPKPELVIPDLIKALLGDQTGRSFVDTPLVRYGQASVPYVQKVLNDEIAGRQAADILRKIAEADPAAAVVIEKAVAPGGAAGTGGAAKADAGLRRSAVQAAGARGKAGVDSLIAALNDGDASVRLAAERTLKDASIESLPALAAALRKPGADKRVRKPVAEAALSVIQKKGWASATDWSKNVKAAIPDLVAALQDADKEVREVVERALRATDEAGLTALADALKSNPDAATRAAAARALTADARIDREVAARAPAAPALAAALKDKDATVRAEAAMALASMKDERALPVLVESLVDDALRDRVKQSMQPYQAKLLPALATLIEDPNDSAARVAAIELLQTSGTRDAMFAAFADPKTSPRARAAYLSALGGGRSFGGGNEAAIRSAVPALLAALRDPDPAVNWQVEEIVRNLSDPSVVVRPALADASPRVRLAGARMLLGGRQFPPKTEGVAAALVGGMKDADPLTRKSTIDTLYQFIAGVQPSGAVDPPDRARLVAIVKGMKSADAAVRTKATGDAAALGARGAQPVVPVLARLLRDPDPGVAKAAEAAMLKLFDTATVRTPAAR